MLNTIKLNSISNLVTIAQYLTKYCAINKASDTFDSAFKAHVVKWQKNNGLSADGIIGKNTWTALAKKAPLCSTKKNTESVYVCAIQLLIGGLTVNGIFNEATKNAVAAFQSAKGLVVDGICGPKTWNALIVENKEPATIIEKVVSTVTKNKVLNDCVKFLQWDSKWKNVKYSTHTSSQTIGNSGCGPTAMAMIVATWVDKTVTPVDMCDLAVRNGYRTYSNGTAWSFFKFVFSKYPSFSKFITTSSVSTLKAALKEGALAVCSMNNKDNKFWTSGGRVMTLAS